MAVVTEITAMAPLMPACAASFVAGVADHHRQPVVAGERDAAGVLVLVVRTAWNPRSNSPPRTRMPTSPPPTTITCPSPGFGSPRICRSAGADDKRGDHRQQRHPVGGEHDLGDLLGAVVAGCVSATRSGP